MMVPHPGDAMIICLLLDNSIETRSDRRPQDDDIPTCPKATSVWVLYSKSAYSAGMIDPEDVEARQVGRKNSSAESTNAVASAAKSRGDHAARREPGT